MEHTFDVSDTGMIVFLLTGDDRATPDVIEGLWKCRYMQNNKCYLLFSLNLTDQLFME